MNLSIFTDIEPNDVAAWDDFQLAHSMVHDDIYNALLLKGKVVAHYPLADEALFGKTWLETHQDEHKQIFLAIGYVGMPDLTVLDAKNADALWSWMDLHRQVHEYIRTALGLP